MKNEVKVLKMRDVISKELYKCTTAAERRRILKWEQAKEYSGWRGYPTTCQAIFDRIPDEWIDQYSARHIGEVAKLLGDAYSDGTRKGEA